MRSNSADAARRAYLSLARGIIVKANDAPRMQEAEVRVFHDERLTEVERFQPYGFSAVPLPKDEDGKAAEVIVAFLQGNRNHAVAIGVDDRRHRPKNWQPGECGLYDDQGQLVRLTRAGLAIDGGPSKKPVTVTVGNAMLKIEDGKVTCTVGGDSGLKIVLRANRIDLGQEDAPYAVETSGGASTKVFAVV